MPRSRTARLAVLGSSVQRSSAPSFPSRNALTRRLAVGILALLSLALVTVYFRETPQGGLHRAQGVGASVLQPFQVGAERVVRPFRDAYGYVSGLVDAKSENARLQAQVEDLQQRYIQARSALAENPGLRAALDYQDTATFPGSYRLVNTRVLAPPGSFNQRITIAAGSSSGVLLHSPVVTAKGLVGEVTKVFSQVSQVTLLTDATSTVGAFDPQRGAYGLVRPGFGALALGNVPKEKVVREGDIITTAGTLGDGLPSLYPRGIQIGVARSVSQSDTDPYMQIQVEPFVDFSTLDTVAVLVAKDSPGKR